MQHSLDNPSFWKEREEKSKATKARNGHDLNWNNREKAKQTCIDNYGVEWFFASDEWKKMRHDIIDDDPLFYEKQNEKRKQTISQIASFYDDVHKKTEHTMLKTYGVKNSLQLERCRENRIVSEMLKKMNFLLQDKHDTPMFDENELLQHYHDKNYKYKFKCKKCGKIFFTELKWVFGRHYHCKKCYPKQKSKHEHQILDYITSIAEDKSKVVHNDRTSISPYELDIVVQRDGLKLAVEFDGLFWHSIDCKTYEKDKHICKNFHLKKLKMCEEAGIILMHVFEDEWIFQQRHIESEIAKKLKLAKKIDSQHCCIKEDENRLVLLENRSNIEVASLKFSKMKSSKDQWQVCYQTTDFIDVEDGLEALLQKFEEKYKPKSIAAFIDRRLDDGKDFMNAGFMLERKIKPCCQWFNSRQLIRHSESHFKKKIARILLHEKFKKTKQQIYALNKLGWMRIYDCGFLKLVKTCN